MPEIYLNGELAEPEKDSKVVLTRQANDITKPDNIQADYSNTVRFPKTKANRQRFGFAEEVESDTLTPYRYQQAQLISEGVEVLPYGKFELKESAKAYEGTLFSGNIRFFDALGNRKLTDLNLSEFNHPWTRAKIVENLQNTENFFYPLLNIGMNLDPASVMARHIFPAVYVKLLWERIFEQAGFAYDMEAPEMFAKEFLPVSFAPKYSKEFIEARSHYAYVPYAFFEDGDQSSGRGDIVRNMPLAGTDRRGYYGSTNLNYNPATQTYTATDATIVDITARCLAYLRATIGTASARLTVYHNGTGIKDHYLRTTDIAGKYDTAELTVEIKDLLLQKGDTLRFEIRLQGETTVNKWGFRLYYRYFHFPGEVIAAEDIAKSSVEIKVKDTFPAGGEIDLINWLPDMSQKDFIKAMVKNFGWTMQTDPYENRIKLTLFNAVLRNRDKARDWTAKRDFSEVPAVGYTFGSFGQRNLFKWKEDDKTPEGYGDGVVVVDNETLEAEHKALEMPFAASDKYLEFLNVPIYDRGQDGEFSPQKLQPRLALRSDKKVSFGLTENGNLQQVEGFKVYFADSAEPYDLDMQRTIIPTFYDTLLAILNKCKRVKAYYRLSAQDMQEFDQSIPVWDGNFGQYFYLNQIEQYEEGKPTLVHLYRLGEPVNQ